MPRTPLSERADAPRQPTLNGTASAAVLQLGGWGKYSLLEQVRARQTSLCLLATLPTYFHLNPQALNNVGI